MSRENVDNLRRNYEHFIATGEFSGEFAPDFVWDMSTFRNWPERQTYEGIEGARQFLAEWLEAWDDWELELEELRDADESVVAIVRQRGRSKATGLLVDMHLGQVCRSATARTSACGCMQAPMRLSKPRGFRSRRRRRRRSGTPRRRLTGLDVGEIVGEWSHAPPG